MDLLTNSLNYDWSMFSRVLPSLDRVKMRDNLFVTVGLAVMIFRAALIMHFKIAAVLAGFLELVINSKTFDFIVYTTRHTFFLKTIAYGK
jgi:hypothetical protein